MEPQGSGKRSADQLQGSAVQDQAIRSVSARSRVAAKIAAVAAAAAEGVYRIVVRFEDRTIRGTALITELGPIEQLLRNDPHSPLDTIRLNLIETGEVEEIPTREAKAVFFVKTFDGDVRHKALHFHENAPIVPGLWVRVHFYDNEMIEGIISNTRDFVLEDGFFLIPTDPNGNNRLVYVNKSGLKDFHVLGMRNPPKNLHAI
jgi:hypothetical protein